jgi:hypothetical protein
VFLGSSTTPGAGGVEYDLTLTIPKGAKPTVHSELFVIEWALDSQVGSPYMLTEGVYVDF